MEPGDGAGPVCAGPGAAPAEAAGRGGGGRALGSPGPLRSLHPRGRKCPPGAADGAPRAPQAGSPTTPLHPLPCTGPRAQRWRGERSPAAQPRAAAHRDTRRPARLFNGTEPSREKLPVTTPQSLCEVMRLFHIDAVFRKCWRQVFHGQRVFLILRGQGEASDTARLVDAAVRSSRPRGFRVPPTSRGDRRVSTPTRSRTPAQGRSPAPERRSPAPERRVRLLCAHGCSAHRNALSVAQWHESHHPREAPEHRQ